MLGVDDVLVAIVRQRMRARRAQAHPGIRRQREEPAAAVALARDGVGEVGPGPERISISEEISSPATDSASAGSRGAAALRSSKRPTSSRDAGSRIGNSSSRPTVKSVEDSNASRALSRSKATGRAAGQTVT